MATRLKQTDVVMVGLGCAGGLAAMPLAQAGIEVVGLEAGPRLTPADYVADEVRNSLRRWMGNPKANHEVPDRPAQLQRGGDQAPVRQASDDERRRRDDDPLGV